MEIRLSHSTWALAAAEEYLNSGTPSVNRGIERLKLAQIIDGKAHDFLFETKKSENSAREELIRMTENYEEQKEQSEMYFGRARTHQLELDELKAHLDISETHRSSLIKDVIRLEGLIQELTNRGKT